MTVVRTIAFIVGAIAVLILSLRAAVGPFSIVNSPFTVESAFWVAILALLWLGRDQISTGSGAKFPFVCLAGALCVVALAFIPNLADPFLSDDYILLRTPPFHWNTFLAEVNRAGGDGSFRPLGTVYYQIVKLFSGTDPVRWHLTGLSFHLLNCALVFLIAWKLWCEKTVAAIASLIFGLHGTRPEAALWTAGNRDLLACACVLGALWIALDRGPRWLGLVLVAIGILFKESAYATPLIAFALLMMRPSLRLKTFVIGSVAVCGVLFAWRWHLFHGPGGYVNPVSGRPAILSLSVLTAAKAIFLRTWAILFAPINWDAPRTWWLSVSLIAWMGGALLLAMRRRAMLWLIAATCFAVLPAIHLALIGQSENGSRILYLAGAPFALLIGSLASDRRSTVIAIVMVAGMAGILEHNLRAWHAAGIEAREICRDAKPRPEGEFEGVVLFENGYAECVAAARGQ